MTRLPAILIGIALSSLAGKAGARQPCSPEWSSVFASGAVQGLVRTNAVFDIDGPGPLGPCLVIGGDFSRAGGVAAPYVAYWSGREWLSLGGVSNAPSNRVYTIAVHDEDDQGPLSPALFIGGTFASIGSTTVNSVARWTGSTWEPLGSGIRSSGNTGAVRALTVFDDDGAGPRPPGLYAAGTFDSAGGVAVRNIARWSGQAWAPLGEGVGDQNNDYVASLAVLDEDGPGPNPGVLFASGELSIAGTVAVTGVARWDGAEWTPAGTPLNTTRVEAIGVFDEDAAGPGAPKLFVAAGVSSVFVLRLDTAGWTPLAGPIGVVRTMAVVDDDALGPHPLSLVLGGDFGGIEGTTSLHLGRWDGSAWHNVGAMGTDGPVFAMTAYDSDGPGPGPPGIAISGSFATAGTVSAGNVALLGSQQWSCLGNGLDGEVRAMAPYDPDGAGGIAPVLILGGTFRYAGSARVNGITAWDGRGFSSLGTGVANPLGGGDVLAITIFDEDGGGPANPVLVVAGDFTNAGGQPANRIAKWDGTTWAPIGAGFDSAVNCLAVFDEDGPGVLPPRLVAGGRFQFSGLASARYLARWTGAEWTGISSQFSTGVRAMAVYDEDGDGPNPAALFVAHDDSNYPAYLGRWSGGGWSVLGTGLNQLVMVLTVIDPDESGPTPKLLFAGGRFGLAGPLIANHLAAWDGQAWQSVGLGANNGVAPDPYAIQAFDPDGGGPHPRSLCVAGNLASAGQQAVSGVARFDGSGWLPLGSGLGLAPDPVVAYSMAVFDDSKGALPAALFVGGAFSSAGGKSSANLGRWGCSPTEPCLANCDGSTIPPVLNANDFVCFMNRYAAADPWANCDGSNVSPVLNINDFVCFVNRYASGCP